MPPVSALDEDLNIERPASKATRVVRSTANAAAKK